MLNLQYINASLGTLVKQGTSFFKVILWKVFPLAFVCALLFFVTLWVRLYLPVNTGFAGLRILVDIVFMLLVTYFALALIYQMYGPTRAGQLPSIVESLAAVLPKVFKVIITGLLAVLASLLVVVPLAILFGFLCALPSMHNPVMNIVSKVLLAAVVVILLVSMSLIPFVVLFENVGIIKSIKRSVCLVWQGFWKAFVVLVIAIVPYFIFTYLVIAIVLLFSAGGLASFHAYVMMHGALIPMIIIQSIIFIGSPFFIIWRVANSLNLYHTFRSLDETS